MEGLRPTFCTVSTAPDLTLSKIAYTRFYGVPGSVNIVFISLSRRIFLWTRSSYFLLCHFTYHLYLNEATAPIQSPGITASKNQTGSAKDAPAAWGCTLIWLALIISHSYSTPADEPLMNTAPLPVIGRQVTPGCSCSQYLKHRIDKTAIILSNPAPLTSLPGQMWFKQLPYFLIYIMFVIGCIHRSLSRLFRYFHSITIPTSFVDAI